MKKPPPLETRFRPGQSGNPGGRKKKDLDLTKALSAILAESHGRTRLTKLEKILRVMVNKAIRGHQKSGEWIIERMFGRLKMTVDATVYDGEIHRWLSMSHEELSHEIKRIETDEELKSKYNDDQTNED